MNRQLRTIAKVLLALLAWAGACGLPDGGLEEPSGPGGPGGAPPTSATSGGGDLFTTTSASASGGGGAGTGGAGGGGASSSSGTGGGVEDCTDGVDNDGDGLDDCEDDDCTADFTCVAAVPNAVQYGTLAATTGLCSPQNTETAYHACDDCACTVTDEGSCQISIQLFDNAMCMGMPVYTNTQDGSCDPTNIMAAANGKVGVRTSFVGAGDGQCDPGSAVAPTTLYACAVGSGGHCKDPTKVCIPKDPTFTCIAFPGEARCTAPFNMERHVVYDESAFTTCDCACTTNPACPNPPSSPEVYQTDNTCSGGAHKSLTADGMCKDTTYTGVVGANFPGKFAATPAPATTCSKSVNKTTAALTFCCK